MTNPTEPRALDIEEGRRLIEAYDATMTGKNGSTLGAAVEAEELLYRFLVLNRHALLDAASAAPVTDEVVAGIRERSDNWDYSSHWRSKEGDEMAASVLFSERTRPDMTDFEVANWVFLCDRNSLGLIAATTMAKERIRWLSVHLAKAQGDIATLLSRDAQREAEMERLRLVLVPIVNEALKYDLETDEDDNTDVWEMSLKLGDLRRAANALKDSRND